MIRISLALDEAYLLKEMICIPADLNHLDRAMIERIAERIADHIESYETGQESVHEQ